MSTTIKKIEIGYLLNLFSKEELINWSDNQLQLGRTEQYYIELSSLSTHESKDVILGILEKYSNNLTEDEFRYFHKQLMSYILSKRNDWSKLQESMIVYFDLFKDYFDNNDFEFWSRLKDDYYLKQEGLTGCMQFPNELITYLNLYSTGPIYNDFFKILNT